MFSRFSDIVSGKGKISLRLLDWFVTNYSKNNKIVYENKKLQNKSKRDFFVYTSYRSQLKAYSKKMFDPFCRRERIRLEILNNEIETTIGQLNFFKWAINNNVLDYVQENCIDIENDMYVSHRKGKRNMFSKKKIPVHCIKYIMPVTISFD